MLPVPWKLLSVPPITVTSLTAKLKLGSLKEKLMVAVSPVASAVLLLLTTMVGGVVSPPGVVPGPTGAGGAMLSATALLGSPPSPLVLPAASLKVLLATTMAPLVEPLLGVKVAL